MTHDTPTSPGGYRQCRPKSTHLKPDHISVAPVPWPCGDTAADRCIERAPITKKKRKEKAALGPRPKGYRDRSSSQWSASRLHVTKRRGSPPLKEALAYRRTEDPRVRAQDGVSSHVCAHGETAQRAPRRGDDLRTLIRLVLRKQFGGVAQPRNHNTPKPSVLLTRIPAKASRASSRAERVTDNMSATPSRECHFT
ncbi:hypothetical protein MRX96_009651 [Rhipicephalus microplus]